MKITIKDNKIFISETLGNCCFATTQSGNICLKRRPQTRKTPCSPKEIANRQRFSQQAKDGTLLKLYREKHSH